jgi:hypothetical protein
VLQTSKSAPDGFRGMQEPVFASIVRMAYLNEMVCLCMFFCLLSIMFLPKNTTDERQLREILAKNLPFLDRPKPFDFSITIWSTACICMFIVF